MPYSLFEHVEYDVSTMIRNEFGVFDIPCPKLPENITDGSYSDWATKTKEGVEWWSQDAEYCQRHGIERKMR